MRVENRNGARLSRQQGVVLLFSLITLVVLLIAAVALIRSFSNSLFTAGNIAFKRDLQNQSERVFETVRPKFLAGGELGTVDTRSQSVVGANYSAVILPTNAQGVPLALLASNADFASVGLASNDITVGAGQAVTIRYVIDRLCDNTGLDASLGPDRCVFVDSGAPQGGSSSQWQRAEVAGSGGAAGAVPQQSLYRISAKVTGPRNTEAFFQTTFGL